MDHLREFDCNNIFRFKKKMFLNKKKLRVNNIIRNIISNLNTQNRFLRGFFTVRCILSVILCCTIFFMREKDILVIVRSIIYHLHVYVATNLDIMILNVSFFAYKFR